MRSLLALVLAALAACGAADPGLRRTTPPPLPAAADLDWGELTFAGAGGVQLYGQHWRPRSGAIRGVVVIHHGLADHSARYAGFAEELARAGYAVWALDMRGHGRSAGPRVTADRVDDFLDDLDAFMAEVRRAEPGQPIFLFGHSLGGMIVTLDAIERQPALAGLIVSGPALAFDAPPIQAAAIRFIAGIAPGAPLLATPHGDFSSSRAVIDAMDRDPLIYAPKGPARTARSAVDGVARIWAAPERLRVPLLALHGTIDKLTAPAGSRELVARAGSTDKTLRIYPGLNHDLLHEPDGHGAQVAGEIRAWLDAHTGGAPVAFTSSQPGRLVGDARPSLMAVEVELRDEEPRGEAFDRHRAITAGLRLRVGAGRSHGFGYHGGIDLQLGELRGFHYAADAALLGVALRTTGGTLLAATVGVGVFGVDAAWTAHAPLGVELEAPVGPIRILARARLALRISGASYGGTALVGDEDSALLGVRLGRDRHYWATVVAGAGPYLAVTYRNIGGAELWGIALGGQLWGGS
jgi:alpha-beta hydrolase superfamily lysophospholipase